MSNTTQKQILTLVEELLEEQPDMRFGQMIASLALFARGPLKSATWDVEDEELREAAQRHLQNLRRRREARGEVNQLTTAQAIKSAA